VCGCWPSPSVVVVVVVVVVVPPLRFPPADAVFARTG
jgi:hypothetical protein